MRNTSLLAIGFLMVMGLSACGNITTAADQLNPQDGVITSGLGNISGSGANQCSYTANITSTDSYDHSTTNRYVGCPGSAAGTLTLYPEDNTPKNICVFPVQVTNGHPSVYLANQNNPPASRYTNICETTNAAGTAFNFGSVTFNAVYIVNQDQVATFANCLSSGGLSECTAAYSVQFSFGTL